MKGVIKNIIIVILSTIILNTYSQKSLNIIASDSLVSFEQNKRYVALNLMFSMDSLNGETVCLKNYSTIIGPIFVYFIENLGSEIKNTNRLYYYILDMDGNLVQPKLPPHISYVDPETIDEISKEEEKEKIDFLKNNNINESELEKHTLLINNDQNPIKKKVILNIGNFFNLIPADYTLVVGYSNHLTKFNISSERKNTLILMNSSNNEYLYSGSSNSVKIKLKVL